MNMPHVVPHRRLQAARPSSGHCAFTLVCGAARFCAARCFFFVTRLHLGGFVLDRTASADGRLATTRRRGDAVDAICSNTRCRGKAREDQPAHAVSRRLWCGAAVHVSHADRRRAQVRADAGVLRITGSCIGFRRHLRGDARLDWLFVPGFFGFAFGWGFYTFLVAAPLGILFIWLSYGYATATSVRKSVEFILRVLCASFPHGLVFLFAAAIGELLRANQTQKLSHTQGARARAYFSLARRRPRTRF